MHMLSKVSRWRAKSARASFCGGVSLAGIHNSAAAGISCERALLWNQGLNRCRGAINLSLETAGAMRCGAKLQKSTVAPGRYMSKGKLQPGMPLTVGQCRHSRTSQIGVVKSTASSLPGCWARDASPSRHTRQRGRITAPLQPQRNVSTSDSQHTRWNVQRQAIGPSSLTRATCHWPAKCVASPHV